MTDVASPTEASNPLMIEDQDFGPIGLLMLDDALTRDLMTSSPYVVTEMVEGCTVERLIYEADPSLEAPMVAAGRSLVAKGARAITGNCGFMMQHQAALRNAVDVPVLLSSLMLAPMILATLGDDRRLGVVTASLPSLTDELLKEAGVLDPSRIVIGNMSEEPAFRSAWLEETSEADIPTIEQETLAVSRKLVANHPEVTAILLECTALPLFSAAIEKTVEVPVFDIVSLIDMFVQGFTPGVRSMF